MCFNKVLIRNRFKQRGGGGPCGETIEAGSHAMCMMMIQREAKYQNLTQIRQDCHLISPPRKTSTHRLVTHRVVTYVSQRL